MTSLGRDVSADDLPTFLISLHVTVYACAHLTQSNNGKCPFFAVTLQQPALSLTCTIVLSCLIQDAPTFLLFLHY